MQSKDDGSVDALGKTVVGASSCNITKKNLFDGVDAVI